ncbi:MAG: hypothetical protein HY917_03645 [Candidatus Diapherotrites archaeon]|nr:hypothetical protein [Candidatus Diapherotrites archaeon]
MPRMHGKKPEGSTGGLEGLSAEPGSNDFRALQSSLQVLAQQMNYVMRNEKILGRNLLVLNKKLKSVESQPQEGGVAGPEFGELRQTVKDLTDQVARNAETLLELQNDLASLREQFVSREEFLQLKFTLEAINPSELVNLKTLNEMLGKREEKTAAPKLAKK